MGERSGRAFHSGETHHQELVALVYDLNPDKTVDALLRDAKEDYNQHGHIFGWRAFQMCWDSRLSGVLGAFSIAHVCNRATLISSLSFLLERDSVAFHKWMWRILPRAHRLTEDARVTLLAIAFALSPADLWDVAWPQISGDADRARKVLLSVASTLDFEARKRKPRLTAQQLSSLAELLYSLFPPDEKLERHGGVVTPRQAVGDYRRGVMDAVTASTDHFAGEALLTLAKKFPDWEIEFMWRYRDHLRTRRRVLWAPPSPEEMLQLMECADARFASTDEDLFQVVLESLNRFERYYTRQELPAVERLWRWEKKGNRRVNHQPKEEEDLSDELARWLRDDLQSRGIIVGREVQIERKQKTDVLVKAIAAVASDTSVLTVVVEVKGCWNPSVCEDVEEQLVKQYLLPHELKYGIYIVGWFVCDVWHAARNSLTSDSIDAARDEVRALATQTAGKHPGVKLAGVALDCRYR